MTVARIDVAKVFEVAREMGGFGWGQSVRHIYLHPSKADRADPRLEALGLSVHLDPECPPETAYFTSEPLEDPAPPSTEGWLPEVTP